MKYLIKDFDKWEEPFLDAIRLVMSKTFSKAEITTTLKKGEEPTFENFPLELMHVPYILVRYLSSFFLQGETEVADQHKISDVEYEKVLELGKRLEIDDLNVFKAFCATFVVK